MKKVVKFPANTDADSVERELWEKQLREKLEISDRIRADGINDLDNFSEDLQHISLVVESLRKDYRGLLAENRLLKTTLLSMVDECYCWSGNRCDRCNQILEIIAGKVKQADSQRDLLKEYKDILKYLRKQG